MTTDTLWRRVVGRALRARRQERRKTLAQVAARAGLSIQYLSEVERGQKDASSEMLSAIVAAQDWTLLDLTRAVAGDLELREQYQLLELGSRALPAAGRHSRAGGSGLSLGSGTITLAA